MHSSGAPAQCLTGMVSRIPGVHGVDCGLATNAVGWESLWHTGALAQGFAQACRYSFPPSPLSQRGNRAASIRSWQGRQRAMPLLTS